MKKRKNSPGSFRPVDGEIKGQERPLLGKISGLIERARRKVAASINHEMVLLYWNIGKAIKEEIMKSARAGYGKQVIQLLSAKLTEKYGKGFSVQNLWYMLQLYEIYPILHAVRGELEGLSWTHIRTLLPIKDKLKRKFYAILCLKEHWSTRTLENRIGTMLYERTALSKLPEKTIEMQLKELKEKDKVTPEMVFRDPYVLDFLELSDTYSEKDLESAILNALEKFILEMGSDFYFVARQKRITLDNIDYYIDLLFYHRKLRCFVAIDLKLDKFRAEYKGQMELYLRYIERYEMDEGENPPVGMILCAEKGRKQIELLCLPQERIRVSEYLTKLPSKELFAEKLKKAIRVAQLELRSEKGRK
ncbi:MAG: cytoplasmic protein [Elusimicrobia bacterium HGW-Elusimicrobia-2]|nr:MAG: cytoplasmic protein [Elusimicrobia bacterium HGW-Elusimicrobia-2]